MVKVIRAKREHYLENVQEVPIKFSYVKKHSDEEYEQLHYGVKCRDFLGDVLLAEEQDTPFTAYHFTWDNSVKIDRDKTRLLINQSSRYPVKKRFKEHLYLLHKIEENNGLEKTVIIDVPYGFILEADKFWLGSTQAIWLYSFLIRVLCNMYFNKETFSIDNAGADCRMMYNMKDFHLVLDNIKYLFGNQSTINGYPKNSPLMLTYGQQYIHNNQGLYTILTGGWSEYVKENEVYIRLQKLKKMVGDKK